MCRCLAPRKTFGTFCCYMPLALFALVSGIAFGLWGGYDIYVVTQNPDFATWQDITNLILAGLRALMGVMGIAAVLFRWAPGAQILVSAYNIILVSAALTFIMQWIVWIQNWTKKPQPDPPFPSDAQLQHIIIFTTLYVIFFIASWWVVSCFSSFAAVLRAGGHGWERKNHLELKEERAERVRSAKMAAAARPREVGDDDLELGKK